MRRRCRRRSDRRDTPLWQSLEHQSRDWCNSLCLRWRWLPPADTEKFIERHSRAFAFLRIVDLIQLRARRIVNISGFKLCRFAVDVGDVGQGAGDSIVFVDGIRADDGGGDDADDEERVTMAYCV